MKSILLTTAYFPSVNYLSLFLLKDVTIFIEQFENYNKQSYRNRCRIISANGILDLYIPVKKHKKRKTPIRDVKISYEINWQKNHFKSIESAYRSSPFYEFYIDDLLPFFEKKYEFLFDFNLELLSVLIELLDIDKKIILTDNYISSSNKNYIDYRTYFHPKENKHIENFTFPVYKQVFDERLEFQKNMSIIDLLFNQGVNSVPILKGVKHKE